MVATQAKVSRLRWVDQRGAQLGEKTAQDFGVQRQKWVILLIKLKEVPADKSSSKLSGAQRGQKGVVFDGWI